MKNLKVILQPFEQLLKNIQTVEKTDFLLSEVLLQILKVALQGEGTKEAEVIEFIRRYSCPPSQTYGCGKLTMEGLDEETKDLISKFTDTSIKFKIKNCPSRRLPAAEGKLKLRYKKRSVLVAYW